MARWIGCSLEAGLPKLARPHRASLLDPYLPFVRATLEQYPTLAASRLYAMVRERGYAGGEDHFRHLMLHYRPRALPEAYLRLKTLPGEQAQVDWGHNGQAHRRACRAPPDGLCHGPELVAPDPAAVFPRCA